MDFVLKSFVIDIAVKRLANVHYFEFLTDYHSAPNAHNFTELIYVDSGCVDIISERYTGILKKNEMIIHNANQKHSLRCNETIAPNIIIIGFECTNENSLHQILNTPLLLDSRPQQYLTEIVKESRNVFLPPYDLPYVKNMEKRDTFPFGADQLIKNLLECFLIYCVRSIRVDFAHPKSHPTIDRPTLAIQEYIDKNFESGIHLKELCFIFGTNRTTLCKNFKRLTGCTITEYINRLRVNAIKTLLREGGLTLTQIADRMNLSSVHYLTALFKKYERLAPSEYIATLKSKFIE